MTLEHLITATFDREGRTYADATTHPPIDQPTGPGGVTLATLAAFRGRPCTVQDLKELSIPEAAAVIRKRLTDDLRLYHFDQVAYEPLRVLLLDTEYNNGEGRAVRWLQRLLGVQPVDGAIGPRTVAAANAAPAVLLTNAYVAQRAHAADAGDARFRTGLIARALSFVIAVDDL